MLHVISHALKSFFDMPQVGDEGRSSRLDSFLTDKRAPAGEAVINGRSNARSIGHALALVHEP